MQNQLEGKNVIVTGANCGIGYEAALELAKRGPYFLIQNLKYSFKNKNLILKVLE